MNDNMNKNRREIKPIDLKKVTGGSGDWERIHPVIDYWICVPCGECVDYCPCQCIAYDSDSEKYQIDYEYCLECGYCIPVCPFEAIHAQ